MYLRKINHKGQAVIEFTFCMIIILLLFFGCVMAFRWAGVSLAERRAAHDKTIKANLPDNWPDFSASALRQVDKDFYKNNSMNLIFRKWSD